jgi:hypothetical protein
MTYRYRLSSGPFGLPESAASVDWLLLNCTAQTQKVRVTVYAAPIGQPKHELASGPVELSLPPDTSKHDANSVGPVFQIGVPTEVVVETNSLAVLPAVEVWQDFGGTVIPGTRIAPTDFVRVQPPVDPPAQK